MDSLISYFFEDSVSISKAEFVEKFSALHLPIEDLNEVLLFNDMDKAYADAVTVSEFVKFFKLKYDTSKMVGRTIKRKASTLIEKFSTLKIVLMSR